MPDREKARDNRTRRLRGGESTNNLLKRLRNASMKNHNTRVELARKRAAEMAALRNSLPPLSGVAPAGPSAPAVAPAAPAPPAPAGPSALNRAKQAAEKTAAASANATKRATNARQAAEKAVADHSAATAARQAANKRVTNARQAAEKVAADHSAAIKRATNARQAANLARQAANKRVTAADNTIPDYMMNSKYWNKIADDREKFFETISNDVIAFRNSSINNIYKGNNKANISNKYKRISKTFDDFTNDLADFLTTSKAAADALTAFETDPTNKTLENTAKEAIIDAQTSESKYDKTMAELIKLEDEIDIQNIKSKVIAAREAARDALNKEEAESLNAVKEQANMEAEQNAFAEENAALNAATAAAVKEQANMEAEENAFAEENAALNPVAEEAAAENSGFTDSGQPYIGENRDYNNMGSNNGSSNSSSNNSSSNGSNNGSSSNGSSNNGRDTFMTNYNTDTCPTIDANDFKTHTHLGANFLSLYGCFLLEGYDTKLCNPSGFLLKFNELSTIQLNNKAEAAIYIYLLNYKDKFNAILESTIPNDKKISKIIILRETTVRVLIHCFAYYALLCGDDNNDMVKYDELLKSTDNFAPNTGNNNLNPNTKIDTIIDHYFSGETPETIIKNHITSLFSIENIEQLAMDLFSTLSHKKEFIRLEILEQNAYATVLQTFIEIEEEIINSDISDKLLKIYIGEEKSDVLKYFKAELKEGLKDKKAEDVLYNDILYSITISPVRFTSLRELAKKVIDSSESGSAASSESSVAAESAAESGVAAPSDKQSCEDKRDLCLGSDMSHLENNVSGMGNNILAKGTEASAHSNNLDLGLGLGVGNNNNNFSGNLEKEIRNATSQVGNTHVAAESGAVAAPSDEQSCEDKRDLCLGSDMSHLENNVSDMGNNILAKGAEASAHSNNLGIDLGLDVGNNNNNFSGNLEKEIRNATSQVGNTHMAAKHGRPRANNMGPENLSNINALGLGLGVAAKHGRPRANNMGPENLSNINALGLNNHDTLIKNAKKAETTAIKDSNDAMVENVLVDLSGNDNDPKLKVEVSVSKAFIKAVNSAEEYLNAAKLTNDQTIINEALLQKKYILVKILELAMSKRQMIRAKSKEHKEQRDIIEITGNSNPELVRKKNELGNKILEAAKSLIVFKPYIEELLKIDNDNNDNATNLLRSLKLVNKNTRKNNKKSNNKTKKT